MDDVAVAADQDVGRDLGHAVGRRVVLSSGAVDQVRPANVVVDQEALDVGHDGLELGTIFLKGSRLMPTMRKPCGW